MADPEEAYEQFLEFDWTDERWQAYFQDLYPTPNSKQVLRFKKKWYKKNIDPSFDDTYEPPSAAPPPPPAPSSSSSSAAGAGAASFGPVPLPSGKHADGSCWSVMGHKSTICFTAYATALTMAVGSFAGVFPPYQALVLLVLAFVLEILAKYSLKFKAEYLHSVLLDDVGVMPIMSITLLTPGLHPFIRVLGLASPSLTALLSLAQICKAHERLPGFVRELFSPLADNSARYRVFQKRADIELGLGVILVLGIFVARAAPISALLFWNFMMMRYMMSTWTQASFRRVDRALAPTLGSIPGVKHAYAAFKARLYGFVDPESKKAGKLCTIL